MKCTQYGLRPTEYYDENDYPLPVIKSERTLNELDSYCGFALGKVTYFYMFDPDKTRRTGVGVNGYNNVAKIAHRVGGMYLEYSDTRQCNLAGVKISISARMNRRPEYDMTIDELIAEYGDIE